MPRPTEFVDEDWTSEQVQGILDGDSVETHSRDMNKSDLQDISEELGEDFEQMLLEAGSNVLASVGVDIRGEPDLTVVTSSEDIEHIERQLDTQENGVYLDEHDEVLVFTDRAARGLKDCDPVGTTAHELKHRDQHRRYQEDFDQLYPVREATTQLFNMYRDGKIDNESLRYEKVRKLAESDYDNPEELAEETELAADCYGNLREQGLSKEEAMSFILNDYEERRVDNI